MNTLNKLLFYGSLLLMVIFTFPILANYIANLNTSSWTFAGASYVIMALKVMPIFYLLVGSGTIVYIMVTEN